MRANQEYLRQLERLATEYEAEIRKAQDNGFIRESTAKTYTLHTMNFVKWCKGDFVPGGRNKR